MWFSGSTQAICLCIVKRRFTAAKGSICTAPERVNDFETVAFGL
jgi:hypothetical protein